MYCVWLLDHFICLDDLNSVKIWCCTEMVLLMTESRGDNQV